MKERWLEVAPDADQKQEEKFSIWREGPNIEFVDDAIPSPHPPLLLADHPEARGSQQLRHPMDFTLES